MPVANHTRPLNVLFLSGEYPPDVMGGVGTHVSQMVNGLSRAGHHPTVLSYTVGPRSTRHEGNAIIHMVPSDLADPGRSLLDVVARFNRQAVEFVAALGAEGYRPDVIHIFDWLLIEAAVRLRDAFGAPIAAVLGLVADPCAAWWGDEIVPAVSEQERRMFGLADCLLATSRSMRNVALARHALDPARVAVLYPGMDMQPFASVVPAGAAATPGGEKTLMFAGRLTRQKGISALVDAAARVVAEEPNVRYLVVGPDRPRPADPNCGKFPIDAEAMVAAHPGLAGRVTFAGMVPRDELAALYARAYLALVPSIYEPFGYAAIEAMASGVPVVASAVGGLAEIIEDEVTGLLVPTFEDTLPHRVDVDALAAAQLRLLRDPALARRLGLAGRERAVRDFDREAMVGPLVGHYQHAIARRASAGALPP